MSEMSAESTALAARSPFACSRVSNDMLRPLPGVDGRSTWGRRRRDLIAALTAEMSRPPRARDKVLLANVATLIVRTEQLHVQIARGEPVDDDQFIRLSHAAARLLTALGLDKARPHDGPSLGELLANGGAP